MKVLLEAIGSMPFGCQLKYYLETNWELVGMDITAEAFGFYRHIKPYIVPKYSNERCFETIKEIIRKEEIDIVLPTINEGLLMWSQSKDYIKEKYNTFVMISDQKAIDTCTDKWKTYLFFKENNIPTPNTSKEFKYQLLKPRVGRGSKGIFSKNNVPIEFSMEGYISQELVTGEEYTIDVLCDFNSKPIYIIPRKRLLTQSGISTKGVTVYDVEIIDYVEKIINELKPIGIINIQCFKNDKEIQFIEINPRIAGGSTLSFASSDNWFKVIEKLLKGEEYKKKDIIYNNYMLRYYDEVIINKKDFVG